ncbi:MAG: hypothetical protein M3T55_04795, partial [Pseudomonadota bacterium]|nr:hypothetical protein [Pseudomonadota bacterium]
MAKIRRTVLTAGAVVAMASLGATAQTLGPAAPSSPYGAPSYSPPTYTPPSPVTTFSASLSQSDAQELQAALNAAKSEDGAAIRAAMSGLYDPLARKIALWAMADAAPESLSPLKEDEARRDLAGWPRADRRQIAAANRLVVAAADAEFEAGWNALTRLKDARGADAHFARLQAMGQSPLTQSRALYWR